MEIEIHSLLFGTGKNAYNESKNKLHKLFEKISKKVLTLSKSRGIISFVAEQGNNGSKKNLKNFKKVVDNSKQM